jgi:hypothetical protein
MSDLQAPTLIEVTVRGGLDDADCEIARAVVIGSEHEDEQQFTRAAGESLSEFQSRVRTAAAGHGICWGGLPDISYEK